MPMNSQLDWLNNQIDLLQAGKRPDPLPDYILKDGPGEHLAVLQMAAQLNALRPGAARPDAAFLATLWERVERSIDDRR